MRSGAALVLTVLALGACRVEPSGPESAPEAGPAAVASAPVDLAAVEAAFDRCLEGETEAGIARLDSVLARSPAAPDALVSRGLCRWAQWDETDDLDDARAAYADLSAAIEAVEGGARAHTALDQIYSHRAFVAQALDEGWVRTLEDLGRAVELDPDEPRHVLDRGVVHAYAGDTTAARADLRQSLALADSAGDDDPQRRRVVEALLDELGDDDP